MTLKEFREATAHLPDDMEIFIGERLTEETYGLVEETDIEVKFWFELSSS